MARPLTVEKGGGSLLKRSNLWTALGAPTVGITGGLIVSYTLTEPRGGGFLQGGALVCRTALTNLRDVQSGRVGGSRRARGLLAAACLGLKPVDRVAAFLGPPRALPARPVDGPTILGEAGEGDAFAFVLIRQEEDNWCWAAVAQGVEYARRGQAVSQQDVATFHVSRHQGGTCAPPARSRRNGGDCGPGGCSAACGSMHAVSLVLADRGLLRATLSTGDPVTEIKQSARSNPWGPFCMRATVISASRVAIISIKRIGALKIVTALVGFRAMWSRRLALWAVGPAEPSN